MRAAGFSPAALAASSARCSLGTRPKANPTCSPAPPTSA